MRGLAALLVLGEHWRLFLFVGYAQLPEHPWFIKLFFIVCGAGHAGVVIFFVLSGYLVGGSIFRSLKRQWSWKSYLTHRLVRLWVVLLPGLVLCALFDNLRLHWTHPPLIQVAHSLLRSSPEVHHLPYWRDFFGNLLFLQDVKVLTFGSNDALWSLANEFWYYMLFPAVLFSFKSPRASSKLLCAGLSLGIIWLLPWGILMEFPLWLSGVALVFVPPPRLGNRTRLLAAALYLPLLLFCAKYREWSPMVPDYVLAAGTCLLLWVLLSAQDRVQGKPRTASAMRTLAHFSFTLYVVHMPLLALLAWVVRGNTLWLPTGLNLTSGAVLLFVVLAFAYAVAWLTEFRTARVRQVVELRLGAS